MSCSTLERQVFATHQLKPARNRFRCSAKRLVLSQTIHSEDPAMFDKDKLDQFDAVVMLNVTGDFLATKGVAELSDDEKAVYEERKNNLLEFVKSGKGILGTHSSTDAFYSWKEYGDMMGGWFTGHPWHTDVPIKVDSPNSSID